MDWASCALMLCGGLVMLGSVVCVALTEKK